MQLQPDAPGPRPPRDFHGVAVTYARVASDPRGWAGQVAPDTLVILDEAHHLGEDLAWGTGFQQAFAAAPRRLLLSGTPFRSDATPIPGVRYDSERLAIPDVSYTYAEAVADGICRPVTFVTFDGTLSWRSGEDVIESSFETVLTAREASRRYRTAISTELPDGLPRILREADAKLRALRAAGHRDAGALAVAADATHARRIAKLLTEATGRAPVVVLHTEARASQKLAAFRDSREPWIVAVNMVSEGVDIPRLRVGVYATAAKTPLIFRQIVGRFVRTIPGRPPEPSWLYLPAEPVLCAHASEIEHELRRALRDPGARGGPGGAARAARERAIPAGRVRPAERRVRAADDAVRPGADRRGDGDASSSTRLPAPEARAAGRVRAPRRPARGAQPPGRRPAPPRRAQPPRDQRLAEPRGRRRSRRERHDPPARALDRGAREGAHAAPLARRALIGRAERRRAWSGASCGPAPSLRL